MIPDENQRQLGFQRTIQQRFEDFDAANPEVYQLFVGFAWDLKRAGRQRYSSDAILHRIRWHYAVNTDRGEDDYKINDHFSSRYARKLMRDDPLNFEGFFETRTLKSA